MAAPLSSAASQLARTVVPTALADRPEGAAGQSGVVEQGSTSDQGPHPQELQALHLTR